MMVGGGILEIGSHGVHLDLVDGPTAIVNEGGLVVSQIGSAVTVSVVSNL